VSSEVKPLAWQGERLPRGRHKLSAETVRSSQRERLLRAMLESVARDGYEATTVPQVVAAARVSRNAFYEFFADKADCFVAVCDQAAGELLGDLVSLVSEPDWIQAVLKGTRVYLEWWQEHPAFSRAYFVSLPVAGERALAQRDRAYRLFGAMFEELGRRARAEQPELPLLGRVTVRALVLAITELVAEEIRAGRGDRLTAIEPDIAELAIRLLADDATATRALS
jgi:AcrR family transcriptional regulator